MSALLAEIHEAARIARHFWSAVAKDLTTLIALCLFVCALGMWSADVAMMIHHDAERQVAMGGL